MITQKQFLLDVKLQINKFVQEIDNYDVNIMLKNIKQGKMLRSKLVFLVIGKQTFLGAKKREIYYEACNLGAIIEFIHLASLLHDDVLDESKTRRGKPSINFTYGIKKAIMLGDILYSFAFAKLACMDKRIAKSIGKAVSTLSVGELLDMNMSEHFESNYNKYLDMVYKKTASLIEAGCYCAAILANKNEELLSEYGKNLGIAFQLIDDILDITSSEDTLGKPSYSDFKEGKVSVPYILLYERITFKNDLEKLHKKKLSEKEKLWVQNSMQECDVLDDSINIAFTFAILAMSAIDDLPSNKDNQALINLAKDLIKREF
jgi:octaprenyl-diphosphate synthase